VKLFSTYFNERDHNTSTSQADGRTRRQLAMTISHSAYRIACMVKIERDVNFGRVILLNALNYSYGFLVAVKV